ncbi:hypothetical protein ACR0ST_04400 [Aliidiomarina sp. Khilg15.8]
MARLNASKFAKPKLRTLVIKVPEWDGDEIELCEMSGAQRAIYEQLIRDSDMFDENGKVHVGNYRKFHDALMIACSMPEKDKGELSHYELAELIAKWPATGIDRVAKEADALNSLSQESFETAEKNSEGDRLISGATPSPGSSEKQSDSSSKKSPAKT